MKKIYTLIILTYLLFCNILTATTFNELLKLPKNFVAVVERFSNNERTNIPIVIYYKSGELRIEWFHDKVIFNASIIKSNDEIIQIDPFKGVYYIRKDIRANMRKNPVSYFSLGFFSGTELTMLGNSLDNTENVKKIKLRNPLYSNAYTFEILSDKLINVYDQENSLIARVIISKTFIDESYFNTIPKGCKYVEYKPIINTRYE